MDTLTNYTFGSMSLGRNPADVGSDLAVARRAMETGIWFHSSPTYNQGFTYMVLRLAFDENRAQVPKLILKVRDATVPLLRFEVEDSCRRLGIDGIDVAQLVSMDQNPGNLVDQLRGGGGPLVDELASLRSRGLIRNAVIFLTPQNSDAAVEAVQKSDLIDGVILYWNAYQRECSSTAWKSIREAKLSVLALRTLGGGPNDKNSALKTELITQIISDAGCQNASDLALRFVASESPVKTTIGGTSSMKHLEEFLTAAANSEPLPQALLERIEAIQAM